MPEPRLAAGLGARLAAAPGPATQLGFADQAVRHLLDGHPARRLGRDAV